MSDKAEAKSQSLALTPEALQSLISAAVTAAVSEAKKPAPLTSQEEARLKQDNELRAETAKNVLEGMKTRKFEQKACTHTHATGQSHCVFIIDGNYILCQKCQGKIRPEDGVNKDGNAIYDTALFNRLFQELNKTDM
jgi:hypothetical protein